VQLNLQIDLPCSATNVAGVLTLTANWKGLLGNDITVIPNYYGPIGGQVLPRGVTCVNTSGAGALPFTGGTTAPDFTTALAAVQPLQYLYFGIPYDDSATMALWATEIGFGPTGRWSYQRQQYGFMVNAHRDTYANLITWGASQNAPVISSMAIEPACPVPAWEVTAAYCAEAADGFSGDPARPLQTLEFMGLLPASVSNRFTQSQQNNLQNSGMAIQAVAPDGNMMILREQTQYQLNSYGQSDTAFGLLSTLATLAFCLTAMKSAITNKYPRVKLVPDGTAYGPGQAIVTPSVIKAEIVSEFQLLLYNGLVSDIVDFIANLYVEIDSANPNRVNVLWPPQLAGQLRSFAVLAQFRLLYNPLQPAAGGVGGP
jgi:phage tail sheath gpL-like